MNYKTYAEAKIANPDCEIVTTGKDWVYGNEYTGKFEAMVSCQKDGNHIIGSDAWAVCNPADYCSTLKEFLDAGYKFKKGDKFIGIDKKIVEVKFIDGTNTKDEEDELRYILSAAALSGGCKIPDKVEPWTIYNNTLPLSELSDEQAAQLFNAWRKGGQDDDMQWNLDVAYRRKPKSERELFIEASLQLMTSETERTMEQMFGAQFDAGARYADLTQHFGENI